MYVHPFNNRVDNISCGFHIHYYVDCLLFFMWFLSKKALSFILDFANHLKRNEGVYAKY